MNFKDISKFMDEWAPANPEVREYPIFLDGVLYDDTPRISGDNPKKAMQISVEHADKDLPKEIPKGVEPGGYYILISLEEK